jgi:hypothetical protein
MSIYPVPKLHNGSLNATFNNKDYIKSPNSGGSTITQTDARYLRNSGIAFSSANTTFSGTVDIGALCTVNNLTSTGLISGNVSATNITSSLLGSFRDINVSGSLNAKQSIDSLVSASFLATQTYSYKNGMVYFMATDSTIVSSFSITDLPINSPLKSYIFTFILQPTSANSAFYINPANVLIDGTSTALTGLANIVLPSSYTHLVQQITIINRSTTTTPSYVALTSVSAY